MSVTQELLESFSKNDISDQALLNCSYPLEVALSIEQYNGF
jgi:hypothetical protein